MSISLVLTVIGKDRPGLVTAISQLVREHGANWEASHMARLSGRFAGILEVSIEPERADPLTKALTELGPLGLRVIVEDSADVEQSDAQVYWIELVGLDRYNIVHDISHILSDQDISVLELTSECSDAPMGGGRIFKMQASVRCPEKVSRSDLRNSLESVANSLMVDIRVEESEH